MKLKKKISVDELKWKGINLKKRKKNNLVNPCESIKPMLILATHEILNLYSIIKINSKSI